RATARLKALVGSKEEIHALFHGAGSIRLTHERDHYGTAEEALEDIYRKRRPGEPPTADSARTLLENLFFNPKRYDLAKVGRYKIGKKLGPVSEAARRQLQARFASLKELDNPDRRDWEPRRWRVFADDQGSTGAPR